MDRRPLSGLCALALLGLIGCGDDVECETKDDCPRGQLCDGQGVCFPPGSSNNTNNSGRTDAGPGDGPADTGPIDLGFADAGDVGPGPDLGTVDVGFPDGGGPDMGFTPDPTSRGFVWAGELRADGGSAFHTYGLLEDRSTATYEQRTQTIPDFEGGNCVLTVERLTSGAPTGYVADSITVAPGGAMAPPSIAYLPVGNGRFEPPAPPPPRLYSQSNAALFGIVASAAPGSVQSTGFVRTDPPPIIFEQSPLEGAPVMLAGGATVMWGDSGLPEDRVTVEVYDANREVVLSCDTVNDLSYAMPASATAAFMGEGPARPWTFEIRHDREATTTAYAGDRSFEVTFRASWGARFSAL